MPEHVVDTSEHLALTLNDLNMLVGAGGLQRTQEEFAELLKSAGFGSVRVIPTASSFCLIEAVPLTSERVGNINRASLKIPRLKGGHL